MKFVFFRFSKYTCNNCKNGIPDEEDRLRCRECPNFDFCKSCFHKIVKKTNVAQKWRDDTSCSSSVSEDFSFGYQCQYERVRNIFFLRKIDKIFSKLSRIKVHKMQGIMHSTASLIISIYFFQIIFVKIIYLSRDENTCYGWNRGSGESCYG